jgi:hypothetical protein
MMWRKEQKQLSLADGLVVRRKGQNEQLDRIGELLNWGGLERLLGGVYGAGEGAASVPAAGDVQGCRFP